MQEVTRWEGPNRALHYIGRPAGPLQGRQYVTRYCTGIAIRSGDVSRANGAFPAVSIGKSREKEDGGKGEARRRKGISRTPTSLPTPRTITKRTAPRLPNPPFGPAARSPAGSRRSAASGTPSGEGARLRHTVGRAVLEEQPGSDWLDSQCFYVPPVAAGPEPASRGLWVQEGPL